MRERWREGERDREIEREREREVGREVGRIRNSEGEWKREGERVCHEECTLFPILVIQNFPSSMYPSFFLPDSHS